MQQKPHTGAPGVHGSEQSGPTAIPHNPQPLDDPIEALMPWSGPGDRPVRLRLHNAGAKAVARAMRSHHGNARMLLWLVAQICAERTFARVGIDELDDALKAITRLWLVVNFVERTEQPDA